MKRIAKGFAIVAMTIGAISGVVTVVGAFNGQPDIMIEFLQESIELMGKVGDLVDRCLEDCFK